MSAVLLPFLFSFLVTLLATPLTIKLAKKYGLVDDPKKPHPAHIQNRIVAKAGGIPMFLAIALSIFFFVPLTKAILGLILGLVVLLLIGIWDDLVPDLSPYLRLATQILAAGIVVASGVGITFVTNPFGGILRLDEIVIPVRFLGEHNLILFADVFAFFWIVWLMNMANWSWGVDGQMPGIIAVSAFTIGFLSFKLLAAGDIYQLPIAQLSFITAATSLGFLIFNWHPAKIFPGDSGSNILGFMIAVLCILTSAKLAAAILVMTVPATDFFYTFLRRITSQESPFRGDQKHLHHLLLRRGWSHQQISLFYILTATVLGFAAANLSSQGKLFTVIGAGTIVLGAILWLHLFYKPRQT